MTDLRRLSLKQYFEIDYPGQVKQFKEAHFFYDYCWVALVTGKYEFPPLDWEILEACRPAQEEQFRQVEETDAGERKQNLEQYRIASAISFLLDYILDPKENEELDLSKPDSFLQASWLCRGLSLAYRYAKEAQKDLKIDWLDFNLYLKTASERINEDCAQLMGYWLARMDEKKKLSERGKRNVARRSQRTQENLEITRRLLEEYGGDPKRLRREICEQCDVYDSAAYKYIKAIKEEHGRKNIVDTD